MAVVQSLQPEGAGSALSPAAPCTPSPPPPPSWSPCTALCVSAPSLRPVPALLLILLALFTPLPPAVPRATHWSLQKSCGFCGQSHSTACLLCPGMSLAPRRGPSHVCLWSRAGTRPRQAPPCCWGLGSTRVTALSSVTGRVLPHPMGSLAVSPLRSCAFGNLDVIFSLSLKNRRWCLRADAWSHVGGQCAKKVPGCGSYGRVG